MEGLGPELVTVDEGPSFERFQRELSQLFVIRSEDTASPRPDRALERARLALGVAWVVIVPAELLGVTSGLGYLIKDARETLSYDELSAAVLIIGLIGWLLDSVVALLIKRFNWHKGDEA